MKRFEFVEQANRKNPLLVIEGARLEFCNFEGREERNQEGRIVNNAGNRKFSVRIEDDALAEQLIADNYKVYIRKPREEGDMPTYYLNVGVSNRFFNPSITRFKSNGSQYEYSWDTVDLIDQEDIIEANLVLQVSPGTNPNTGEPVTRCWLQELQFSVRDSLFANNMAEQEFPQE